MHDVDIVIVGSGVIGLAIGRALTAAGRDVVIVEQHEKIATETSARNSEVIHAGLYYRPGSLKARTCVAGNALIYRYCSERGIPVRRCGKLVVAQNDEQCAALKGLMRNAQQNGVDDLELLTKSETSKLEPALTCLAACHSPSTGTLDSHAFASALETDVLEHGGTLVHRTKVVSLDQHGDGFGITTQHQSSHQISSVKARVVINAAGLGAQTLSYTLSALDKATIPKLYFGKGHYFDYAGAVPFTHLIYPMPSSHALGIHLTRDCEGRARFGPDLTWTHQPTYAFEDADGGRKLNASRAIQRFWPDLDEDKLHPGTTGLRPKLVGPDGGFADFAVHDAITHGVPGYVALYGIESPGLTASLALADYVAGRLQGLASD